MAEYCKKLKYRIENNDSPSVLLGVIVSDKEGFITFKTAKKEYQISKKCILEIEDTREEFRNE